MTRHRWRHTLILALGAFAIWAERATRPHRLPTACPKHGPHKHPFPRGGIPK